MHLEPLGRLTAESITPGSDIINKDLIDKQIKDIVRLPHSKIHHVQDEGISRPLRKVAIAEALSYNT